MTRPDTGCFDIVADAFAEYKETISALTKERDDARRMVCILYSENNRDIPRITRRQVAREHGWSYLFEGAEPHD